MMTSTFPTSRINSRNIKNGVKEIQVKKESLISLEAALKERINEFRELCLKEGELTGHLPADYPLQPREPIPQVRRRITRSTGNISEGFAAKSSMMQKQTPPLPPPPPYSQHRFVQQRSSDHIEPMTLPSTITPPKLSDLTNGVAKFQPYYEESKPFQMSDFYKYSSKHRQKPTNVGTGTQVSNQVKTTRQHQEEAKNSLRFAACDDQIQQSVKLIERSGQKLIEATAKAIAGNPSLAERLNNILPNSHHHHRSGERY